MYTSDFGNKMKKKKKKRCFVLFVYALCHVFLNVSSLNWSSSVVLVPMAIDVAVNSTYDGKEIANDHEPDRRCDFDL